jgi:hypothetical protein
METRRRDQLLPVPRAQNPRDRLRHRVRRAREYVTVIVLEPRSKQPQSILTSEPGCCQITTGDGGVLRLRIGPLGSANRVANSSEDFVSCGGHDSSAFRRAVHHSRNDCGGTAGSDRLAVHARSGPGASRSDRPARTASARFARASRRSSPCPRCGTSSPPLSWPHAPTSAPDRLQPDAVSDGSEFPEC